MKSSYKRLTTALLSVALVLQLQVAHSEAKPQLCTIYYPQSAGVRPNLSQNDLKKFFSKNPNYLLKICSDRETNIVSYQKISKVTQSSMFCFFTEEEYVPGAPEIRGAKPEDGSKDAHVDYEVGSHLRLFGMQIRQGETCPLQDSSSYMFLDNLTIEQAREIISFWNVWINDRERVIAEVKRTKNMPEDLMRQFNLTVGYKINVKSIEIVRAGRSWRNLFRPEKLAAILVEDSAGELYKFVFKIQKGKFELADVVSVMP